jgi:hypothetical protein
VGRNTTSACGRSEGAETRKFCSQPSPAGNGKRSCGLWDNGGEATETSPSRSAGNAEEEAAETEATRQLGRLSSILPSSGAHSRTTPLTPDTTHTGTTRMRERERRSVLSSWSNYVGTRVRSINPGPTVKPCDGSVVQWFSFSAPRNSPPKCTGPQQVQHARCPTFMGRRD